MPTALTREGLELPLATRSIRERDPMKEKMSSETPKDQIAYIALPPRSFTSVISPTMFFPLHYRYGQPIRNSFMSLSSCPVFELFGVFDLPIHEIADIIRACPMDSRTLTQYISLQ